MDPDRVLVEQCQAADARTKERCFRDLYRIYKDRVYNISFRITGNSADALDAAQETFGILYRKIHHFRFHSKFSSWVYRIAVNASIDLKRRGSSARMASLEEVGSENLTQKTFSGRQNDPGPEWNAAVKELEIEIQNALNKLSPKLRAIAVLRHMEGLSYEEIAVVLACSLGTVKSRLARAHEALEGHLAARLESHYTGYSG